MPIPIVAIIVKRGDAYDRRWSRLGRSRASSARIDSCVVVAEEKSKSGSLVGLVLRHGVMKSEDVMPAAAIQTLGAEAIVSRSSELIPAKEWRQRREAYPHSAHAHDAGAERR